jgi:lysyl-tRNA synthetase class 1
MYGFVGASGTAKISSSTGTQMTPSNALEVFEPAMLRWLYLRRPSAQKFSLDFGNEVLRTYDEWDKLLDRQKDGLVSPNENYCIERSTATSRGAVDAAGVRVPFRVLSAAADLTQGNIQQIVRIASAHVDTDEHISCEDLQPRLECAHNWTLKYVPDVERTIIRDCFSVETWQELPAMTRKGLTMFFELTRSDSWTLESLTHALYGVPKLLLGLPIDLKEPTKELKSFQRQFFIGIYKLICGNETGPRLPTLFISLGPERIRRLLLPNNSPENTSA